jgi:hypothetical protein
LQFGFFPLPYSYLSFYSYYFYQAASASIAVSNLGRSDEPIDSVTAGYLTFMGDHLFEQERKAAKAKKKTPPFIATV